MEENENTQFPENGEPHSEVQPPVNPENQNEPCGQQPPLQNPWQPPYAPPPYYYYQQPPYTPQNPWQPNVPPQYPPQKKPEKLSAGVKAFIWVVAILTAAMVIGLIGYGVYTVIGENLGSKPESSQSESSNPGESSGLPESSQTEGESSEESEIEVIPNTDGIPIESAGGATLEAKAVYEKIAPSIVGVVVTPKEESSLLGESQGSGIIATEDGYIITNAHVVMNTRNVNVKIVLYDGSEHNAVVVGFDKTTDLAVLKINSPGNLVVAEFGNSDQLAVGDWVLAIGNPGGIKFSSSLTRGIVSAVNRQVGSNSDSGMTFIQTDAAINPGNSGGALVNMNGQVVGINSSKIVADGYEGMGFAIPISKAKTIIDDLMKQGYVLGRARLGIKGIDLTASEAAYYGVRQGFRIVEISADSSLAGTDAQVDDIIIGINGVTVTCLADISDEFTKYAPGDVITIQLFRPEKYGGGNETEITVTLLEDKGETQAND